MPMVKVSNGGTHEFSGQYKCVATCNANGTIQFNTDGDGYYYIYAGPSIGTYTVGTTYSDTLGNATTNCGMIYLLGTSTLKQVILSGGTGSYTYSNSVAKNTVNAYKTAVFHLIEN